MTTRRGRAQTFLGSPGKLRVRVRLFGEFSSLSINAVVVSGVHAAYVAPEVLKTSSSGTASYTFEADIWSVGIIIYELVRRTSQVSHATRRAPRVFIATICRHAPHPSLHCRMDAPSICVGRCVRLPCRLRSRSPTRTAQQCRPTTLCLEARGQSCQPTFLQNSRCVGGGLCLDTRASLSEPILALWPLCSSAPTFVSWALTSALTTRGFVCTADA